VKGDLYAILVLHSPWRTSAVQARAGKSIGARAGSCDEVSESISNRRQRGQALYYRGERPSASEWWLSFPIATAARISPKTRRRFSKIALRTSVEDAEVTKSHSSGWRFSTTRLADPTRTARHAQLALEHPL